MSKRFQGKPPCVIQTINRLRAAGVTTAEIATAVGVDVDTICRYRDGSRRPNWERGWALVRFAEQRRIPL